MLADRTPASAACACAATRPPVNTFCDSCSPSVHWFLAPKPALLKSMLGPEGQVCAWASAALRSACVAVDAMRGAHNDGGAGGPESAAALTRPENCDLSVFV